MIDTTLMGIMNPIAPCSPAPYEGTATEYIAWSYNEYPAIIAEGKPDVIRYTVNVTYVLPKGKNGALNRTAIRNALINAGFTVPIAINASDKVSQRWVFDTEYKESANG